VRDRGAMDRVPMGAAPEAPAAFDQLFTYARNYSNSSGVPNHEDPMLPSLLSMDLKQEQCLGDHEDRLVDLEKRIEGFTDET